MDWTCKNFTGCKPHLQKVRGCHKPITKGLYPFDHRIRRCPWRIVSPYAISLIDHYNSFKEHGILPYGNHNIGDEPAFIYDAFKAVSETITQVRNDNHKKELEKWQMNK